MGLKVWSRFCEKILRNRKPHNFLSAKFYDDKVDAMQKVSRSSSHHREEINSVVMKMRKLFLSTKVENLNSYLLFPFSFSKEYQGFLKKLHLVFSFKITFLIRWFLNISQPLFLVPTKFEISRVNCILLNTERVGLMSTDTLKTNCLSSFLDKQFGKAIKLS